MSGSILIKHGYIVTMENDEVIKDGSIYLEDGVISSIGRTDEMVSCRAEHTIDASNKIVVPGIINAHDHTSDSFFSSSHLDATGFNSLIEYLKGFKWPIVLKMTQGDYHLSGLLGYLQNLRSGVTTVVDNYYGPKGMNTDGVAEAAVASGLRSVLVKGYHDYRYIMPEEFFESTDDIPRIYRDFYRRWQGAAEGRIGVAVGPLNLLYNTKESIRESVQLSEELDIPLHTHVAQAKRMVDIIRERHGKGYIELFHELGALSSRFQAAHCVWLTDNEIQLLSKAKSTVIHNPTSNSVITDGVAPVSVLLKEGVNVALGTDTYLDMLSAMRFAICLQKVTTMNPDSLNAKTVLKMATIDGARGLGLEKEIGSLRVGKKADVTVVNLKRTNVTPVYNPVVSLVYFSQPRDVETVIVNGRILMDEGEIKSVDEEEILEQSQRRVDKLRDEIQQPT
jgi:5-methylthioadenosine/S-adenosylhomocysteine deaminase